jgi:hypothetical protein
MERRGFSQIISDNGTTYHLPTAEYDKAGDLNRQQVLHSAKAAATEAGKRFAVLVTQAESRTWVGLQTVPTQVASFLR